MSDIDNVTGDVNTPDTSGTPETPDTQQGQAGQTGPGAEAQPLEVADVLDGDSAVEDTADAGTDTADTAETDDAPETTDTAADDTTGAETTDAATESAGSADTDSAGSADAGNDTGSTDGADSAAAAEPAAAPEPGTTFADLGLPERVLRAVTSVGYTEPSPIQAETIPLLMEGHDVVGLAQTGTGKTAAFALPVLAGIDPTQRSTQALVLAPTRELALQVAESFQSFANSLGGVNILPVYGGQAYGVQLSGLRRGAHVVVGTPGRVIDHLAKGSLDLSDLRFMVLDEADEMLNMGFQEDVERILGDTPDGKQVALFSATMPSGIRRLSKQYLNNPREITVKSNQRTAENITQDFLMVSHRNKLDALTRILEVTDFEAMIMFVRTKNETEELAERLCDRGFNAAAINGDIAQAQRERTVDQLKDGRLDILVATDVAARGLDVDRITHVFNYDIPHDTESYVHRIGRTGRAGRSGRAILFVTPRERRLLKAIERATKSTLNEIDLPDVDAVNDVRKRKFAQSLTESLSDPQVGIFRELVTAYAAEHGTDMADIAAALAAQAQGGAEFLVKDRPPEPRPERRGRDDDRRGGGGAFRPFAERFNRTPPTVTDRQGKELAVYRIAVGKRHRVRPGAIVGALANEGGLNSRDFGRINIFTEHSLVELPTDLPKEIFEKLDSTRISGQLINIEPDPGAPKGRPARHRDRDDRDSRGRGGRDDRGGDRGGRGGFRGRDDRGDRGGDRGGRGGFRGRDDRGDRGGDRGGRGGFRGRDDRGGRDGDRGGFRDRTR
ncbi:DEAD/DEAH box helicase [Corynebacterium bovis]|uniref:ATP-dependent RNA helicase DeaD n=1 Tax=Corynebacterium bovis DSM 20582 = CIP 54.80 TaxID=927655 RepID=A0A8H9Y7D7_9CORY|nr:DEAD/DEAH box helicase [Corynebacterium bovis]MBB3116387.1 ATP-dependent RNA helicase DeaD [Corynebacterium bovis DSM 20582 = CIP 54.80]QQC47527.1 DEAD/DEAH box helicase [Corynebacterium bovis]WJY77300.1 ATP-dependent RNA helicase DeaD [Corynebacterium bovis DSM 20582 = CIP 54.80]